MPRFAEDALDANLAVVDLVTSVAEEAGATPAQVALAWLRYRADALGIASVPIPGTRRAARVEENLGSPSVTLYRRAARRAVRPRMRCRVTRFRDMSWISAGRE